MHCQRLDRKIPCLSPRVGLPGCACDQYVVTTPAVDLPDEARALAVAPFTERPAGGAQERREVVDWVWHGCGSIADGLPEIQRPPVARDVAMKGCRTWNQARRTRNASDATCGIYRGGLPRLTKVARYSATCASGYLLIAAPRVLSTSMNSFRPSRSSNTAQRSRSRPTRRMIWRRWIAFGGPCIDLLSYSGASACPPRKKTPPTDCLATPLVASATPKIHRLDPRRCKIREGRRPRMKKASRLGQGTYWPGAVGLPPPHRSKNTPSAHTCKRDREQSLQSGGRSRRDRMNPLADHLQWCRMSPLVGRTKRRREWARPSNLRPSDPSGEPRRD